MNIERTNFKDLLILRPKIFEDERGYFYESYSKQEYINKSLYIQYVQDNQSFNKKKYTFRGFHYQKPPRAQTTLVRVVSGKVLDIAIDIRKGSPSYGEYSSIILSDQNHKQLLIPKGFAHGFITLSENTTILYKMDDFYSPENDRILNYLDKTINFDFADIDANKLIIAEKDKNAPFLSDLDNNFIYGVNC